MDSDDWAGLNRWQRLAHPRSLKLLAAAAAGGLALAAAAWHFVVEPRRELERKRYESTLDIARLYGLQLAYKKAKGTYANDLDSLLTAAPDGALKANLAANVDMNTLAVVGDAKKFKIEINVLDDERTAVKIRGPIAPRVRAVPPVMRAPAPPPNADGAPLPPGR